MYEIIEHTADVGISVKGSSLEGLFAEAASAMFDMMFERKRQMIPSIEVPISVEAPSVDQLMVRWLSELLYTFESRRLVLTHFWIDEIDGGHLHGMAKGGKFDNARHAQRMAIKAVTYHKLKIEEDDAGTWHAEVIFDI